MSSIDIQIIPPECKPKKLNPNMLNSEYDSEIDLLRMRKQAIQIQDK